jgi:hypothetical protein
MNDAFARAVRALVRRAAGVMAVEVDGYDGYVACVVRIARPGRPFLWFVIDYRRGLVRRVCDY